MSGHSKWANIKRKKGKIDAIRGKVTTQIGREITLAVRLGGPDVTGNMRLKLALQRAKENNIPKENIQRAIQKGAGTLEGANYEEIVYEGYGPAGAAIIVEVMTDNRNRTAADIRHIFSKHGGNMGETGCVGWMFKKKGLIFVDKDKANEDDLMMMALDAGAEDFNAEEDQFEIITSPEDFTTVIENLEKANIVIETAKVTMLPDTILQVTDEVADKMMKILDALEEHDDVQEVYSNVDFEE